VGVEFRFVAVRHGDVTDEGDHAASSLVSSRYGAVTGIRAAAS
jgi:hypothetical protein